MNAGDAKLRFPVLGFTPDGEVWGFNDLNTLTSCGPKTIRKDMQRGMELVDAKGRRWVVRSIRRTGRGEPILLWLISAVLSTRQSRIEHTLEPLEPITLVDAQDRICAALKTFPTDFGAADENDPELATLIKKVRRAKTIGAIQRLFEFDSFMAY